MIHHVEPPWRKIAALAVGGLTEVIDCVTGNCHARDEQETGGWFDASRPAAQGIGPLAGQWVEGGGSCRRPPDDGDGR